MNKHTIRTVAVIVALAATAAGVTAAKEQSAPKGKGMPAKAVPFAVMGVYSGTLSGEIVVNGQSIFINDKTSLHHVNKGPVDSGESVSKAAVSVSGYMKGKKAVATMVLIGEKESSDDFSQTTIEGAEGDPATDKRSR